MLHIKITDAIYKRKKITSLILLSLALAVNNYLSSKILRKYISVSMYYEKTC